MYTLSIESVFGETSISFSSASPTLIYQLLAALGNIQDTIEVDDDNTEDNTVGGVDLEDVEYDEEGYAWTYDEDVEAWFWFDEENEEWVEYDESEEDEESEEESEEE